MEKYYTEEIPKTERIPRLVKHLFAKMPEIESARARLITESYKSTEGLPIILRRAKAFEHILRHDRRAVQVAGIIVDDGQHRPHRARDGGEEPRAYRARLRAHGEL